MRARLFACLPLFSAAAACSSAEGQTPVDLQPGRYEVTVANASDRFGPRDEQKSLCFTADHANNFPSEPLKDIIRSGFGCKTEIGERKGNAFSGTRECRSDMADGMTLQASMGWEGWLATDSFGIGADIAMKGGGPGSDNLSTSVSINGKRTGEC